MPILNRDDFFGRLHERLGEDTSEDAIKFLEDMTDTYNDLEKRATGDGTDWQKKYNELDEAWKKRYRHRFFNTDSRDVPPDEDDDRGSVEDISIDDLFKEEK